MQLDTQRVRTTVSLPVWLHRKLKRKAFNEASSFSDVLVKLISGVVIGDMVVEDDLSFFARLRSGGVQISAVTEVRKDRDSHK